MFETIHLDREAASGMQPQTVACCDGEGTHTKEDVLTVAAVVLASAAVVAAWRLLKNVIYNWEFYWRWDALDFDLPFEAGALMNAALLGFAICMYIVAQPHLARIMNRPWEGRSETSATMYWLSGTACAACLLMASCESLPLGVAAHLGLSVDEWGVPFQLSYIVSSIAAYALAAGCAKENPGLVAGVGLSLAPLVALAGVPILLAIGIAFVAVHVLRRVGTALNTDEEWTDEDEEMFEDLLQRRSRVHADASVFGTVATPDEAWEPREAKDETGDGTKGDCTMNAEESEADTKIDR